MSKLPSRVEIEHGELVGIGELEDNIFDIDFENIEADIARQASLYAWVGLQEARAEKEYEDTKLHYKTRRSEKWKELKENYEGGRKGPTIEDLKADLRSDPEIVALKADLNDAKHKQKQWEALKWGLNSRKDMIESYVRFRSSEIQMYKFEEQQKLFDNQDEGEQQ